MSTNVFRRCSCLNESLVMTLRHKSNEQEFNYTQYPAAPAILYGHVRHGGGAPNQAFVSPCVSRNMFLVNACFARLKLCDFTKMGFRFVRLCMTNNHKLWMRQENVFTKKYLRDVAEIFFVRASIGHEGLLVQFSNSSLGVDSRWLFTCEYMLNSVRFTTQYCFAKPLF